MAGKSAPKTTFVNRVAFGNRGDRGTRGLLRQIDLHTWREDGDESHRDRFEFREIGRDDWSIYLFDASRQVHLQLDLLEKKVRYNEHNAPQWDLYGIRSFSAKPTGWMANRVEVGASRRDVQGIYKQVAADQWTEDAPDGSIRFTFTEQQRDDWSVYLHDASRNVNIQLDLHRKKVGYSVGRAERIDLYNVVHSLTKLNGWLVNKVDFATVGNAVAGSFRQTGAKTWVEDSADEGPGIFEFREMQRDEWSVYLHDASRRVDLQLDLHTRIVYYADAKHRRRKQYRILHSDMLPVLGMDSGRTVNIVEFGTKNGQRQGYLHQQGQGEWVETDAELRPEAKFAEIGRDRWSIYLFDGSGRRYLHVDLHSREVRQSAGGAWTPHAAVLRTKSRINGWIANRVTVGATTRTAAFRQTGWTSWVEEGAEPGTTEFHFEEAGRSEDDIHLIDRSRGVHLSLDLREKTVEMGTSANAMRPLYDILEAEVGLEFWRVAHKVTSRSSLTEDYSPSRGAAPVARPVYRTSVSFAARTHHVDIWASEQVTITVNEAEHTVDATKPVRLTLPKLGKISISVPAEDLHCPSLFLHTNLMRPGERHVILPDVEVHKKVVGLKGDALYEARHDLGLKSSLGRDEIGHVQRALVNIAKTAQHSYNETPHGYHHDRAVLPSNMEHPHFMLDVSGGGAGYQPLSRDEVLKHIEGARRIDGDIAQNIFSDIGNFFKKATHVVVHTAEAVVHDVIDTTKHVVNDVVDTVDHVGEDLIHGDILEAGKDLVQGGEHLGKDLVHGAAKLGGDVASGAKQLVVVTLKLVDDTVQFVIHHTGFVGKALGWVLEKAGAALGEVVGWLLDKIGWGDVILTHDVIMDSINRRLDEFAAYPLELEAKADKFFSRLADTFDQDVEKALQAMHIEPATPRRTPSSAHSGAVEKVEWLLGKFLHYTQSTQPLAMSFAAPGGTGPADAFSQLMIDEIGADGGKVKAAFGEAFHHLQRLFEDDGHAPEHLLGALIEIVKGVALLGLDILNKILDALLDLVAAVISGFKTLVNKTWEVPFLSDFYSGIAHGRKMSLLSIASLIVAVPTTILSKALFNERPFATSGAALALNPLTSAQRSVGLTYGAFHIILSVTASANNLLTAGNFVIGQSGYGPQPTAEASFGGGEFGLGVINLLFGLGAQITGNPLTPGEHYVMPLAQAKHDVFEAPNFWAHVVWHYQWGCVVVDTLALLGTSAAKGAHATEGKLSRGGDILAGFNGVRGIVHMALMGVLDHSDRVKQEVLDGLLNSSAYKALEHADKTDLSTLSESERAKVHADRRKAAFSVENYAKDAEDKHGNKKFDHVPYHNPDADDGSSVNDMTDDDVSAWLVEIRNYYTWSFAPLNPDSGIPKKGFGNVMDTWPEIGQFGVISEVMEGTDGISLIVTEFMDFFGHNAEGITYIVRTHQDALL